MSMARLWRDQGQRGEARDLFAPIDRGFTESFDTLDLKEVKALLDELGYQEILRLVSSTIPRAQARGAWSLVHTEPGYDNAEEDGSDGGGRTKTPPASRKGTSQPIGTSLNKLTSIAPAAKPTSQYDR